MPHQNEKSTLANLQLIASALEPVSGVGISIMNNIFDVYAEKRATKFFEKLRDSLKNKYPNQNLRDTVSELLNSENKQEYLFDFIQSAIRTRSDILITMLAIAYGNLLDDNKHDIDQYYDIMQVITNLSPTELKVFIFVSDMDFYLIGDKKIVDMREKLSRTESERRKLRSFKLDNNNISTISTLMSIDQDQVINYINRITSKGLLSRNTGQWDGDDFLITEFSLEIRKIYAKSIEILDAG